MDSLKDNKICICGKSKMNMNKTNWTRHIDACKVMKSVKKSRPINSFFNESNNKKAKMYYSEECPTSKFIVYLKIINL